MKTIQKSGEDYLETIYNLLEKDDHAHSADIAKALGVSKPSTFKAMQALAEQGYIKKESYGAVTLTEKGTAAARAVQKKHKAIRMLLIKVLGVSPKNAEIDACKIEHFIGEETTEKLFDFLKV
ncbi:MAG: metal-dependent transcriptional regulator [Firmicutes bacterium]|nr:metal-dependent transcriptional regulator [Bacillota bacterium]